jgi:hypothetical protein
MAELESELKVSEENKHGGNGSLVVLCVRKNKGRGKL